MPEKQDNTEKGGGACSSEGKACRGTARVCWALDSGQGGLHGRPFLAVKIALSVEGYSFLKENDHFSRVFAKKKSRWPSRRESTKKKGPEELSSQPEKKDSQEKAHE